MVLVDKKLATKLDLPYRRGKLCISDGLAQKEMVQVCRVGSLFLGEGRFEEFDAAVADLEGYQGTFLGPIDGVLGTGLFDQCRLTIDYLNRTVIIEKSGKLPEVADRPSVLPLHRDRFGLTR